MSQRRENTIPVRIMRLEKAKDLPLPSPASAGASGFDLVACIEGEVEIQPGERKLIPTGIALEIPTGYEAQVRPRSGLALKYGVTTLNAPGTIDSDYRGEVGVVLINHGSEVFRVRRGDRIAQLVFARVPKVEFQEVDKLNESSRGAGGFGHTGL